MGESSTLAPSARERALVVAVGGVLGAIAGWCAPLLLGTFVGELHLVRVVLTVIDRMSSIGGGSGRYVVALIGGALGGILTNSLVASLNTLTVDRHSLYVLHARKTKRWARSQVHNIVVEKDSFKSCVISIRDAHDVDLQRTDIDFTPEEVLAVLRKHGWPARMRD
ncbi:YqeB family protein [Kocuria sp. HSID16901]|uniref:YqeB family protein n=1 Tax=Kocuria sp. HSID16901 TaxID=2419505 RepID=UPI00066090C4|nr:hypothetical protein [Kocuria sp. HSID16901]RUQ20885.1 hypothetical protein D8M21_08260 [Kocuria sp. HSID16901]